MDNENNNHDVDDNNDNNASTLILLNCYFKAFFFPWKTKADKG